jgi:acetoacetyl-CoA synthetase
MALYQPPNPESSATFRFLARVNATFSLSLTSYSDLYTWSTTNIADFWRLVWDETKIIGYRGNHVVDRSALPPANPAWFAEAKVNWAENMLQCRSAEKVALIHASAFSLSIFRPIITWFIQLSPLQTFQTLNFAVALTQSCIR